ncbi:hypothetical protein Fleli_1906 [Bernardetia litoralis DSM 6794]|uniref:Uncharacterized protein n=1 Tax=Bernardetia litoralis (strain ATCC 23117 / DSM 6794 / NBRC 15988 / NCIMB 1366 / Fx l1 / Sio-4) TaxID=880071 RepID=I4AK11_BERLS|nr:hypothetical protein [Bernardetia litoralis]AFM04296.1 hypothetical protein Fleli_1906 [Bernardetia litoralis DSM 6794]
MNNKLSFKFQTLFSLSIFCVGIIGIAAWSLSLESNWKFLVIGIAAIIVCLLLLKVATMPISFQFSKKELIVSYLILPKKKWLFEDLKNWNAVEIKTFNDVYKIIELNFLKNKTSQKLKKVGISKQEYKGFEVFDKFMNKNFRELKTVSN